MCIRDRVYGAEKPEEAPLVYALVTKEMCIRDRFKNADKTNVNAEPAPAEKANAKKEGK